MTDQQSETQPPYENETTGQVHGIWMRALYTILFFFLFGIAETLLALLAVVQFFWMLFKNEPHGDLQRFGQHIGGWLHDVALFQSGVSEDRPFPWGDINR